MTPPLPPIPPRRRPDGPGLPPLSSLAPRGPRVGAGLPPLAPRLPRGAGGLPPIAPPGPAGPPPGPPRGPLRRLPRGTAAGGLAVLALVAAGAVGGLASRALDDDGPARAAVSAAPEPVPTAVGGRPDLADAVAVASPSVVQVRTDIGAQGSGVILSPSGLVVTNEHVVRGAAWVRLDTDDGRTMGAVVERADASEDLAVLRPEVTPGQGARLASDTALRPGDQVFAIGSPFQLQNSVTAGVVSAVGRRDPESGVPMIQIDAPINPGSSGGGLFDLRGRLVGIPTAILAPIRANVGIGFAVPASRVQRLVDSIP